MLDSLSRALSQLLALDAHEARLVVRRGECYVIAIRRDGTRGTHLELGTDVGGAAFKTDAPLRGHLIEAGFKRTAGPSGKVWALLHPDTDGEHPADEPELARHLARGFELLGASATEATYEITVDAQPPPQNPRLVEAMREVARSAEVPVRQALYAALANGQLVVPIDSESLKGPPEDHAPLQVDSFEGGPVLAVFTDVDALRRWRHVGHPWAGVHGVDFFAHAHRVGATAVRVNPEGEVGGELYGNEVEAIVEGIRRFQASTMN